MKELSIEEKAKAYDEALKVLRKYDGANIILSQSLKEEMFPELKENRDEKIKKLINRLIRYYHDVNFPTPEGFSRKDLLDWVEKQGEQKPADSKIIDLDELVIELEETIGTSPHSRETIKDFFQKAVQKYMKCLQIANGEIGKLMDENYYLKEQKPTSWSEEDKMQLDAAIHLVSSTGHIETANWLKSLRPQNWTKEDKERYISCLQKLSTGNPEQPETINSKWFKEHVYPKPQWKPSDKQIYSLDRVLSFYGKGTVTYDFVKELLEQLKKL